MKFTALEGNTANVSCHANVLPGLSRIGTSDCVGISGQELQKLGETPQLCPETKTDFYYTLHKFNRNTYSASGVHVVTFLRNFSAALISDLIVLSNLLRSFGFFFLAVNNHHSIRFN